MFLFWWFFSALNNQIFSFQQKKNLHASKTSPNCKSRPFQSTKLIMYNRKKFSPNYSRRLFAPLYFRASINSCKLGCVYLGGTRGEVDSSITHSFSPQFHCTLLIVNRFIAHYYSLASAQLRIVLKSICVHTQQLLSAHTQKANKMCMHVCFHR